MSVGVGRIVLGVIGVLVASIVILACGALQGMPPDRTLSWLISSSYWTANVFLGLAVAIWINEAIIFTHLNHKLEKYIKMR